MPCRVRASIRDGEPLQRVVMISARAVAWAIEGERGQRQSPEQDTITVTS